MLRCLNQIYTMKKLKKIQKSSDVIDIDDSSKIILMSDCHRGDGSWADDFTKNKHIYYSALSHYYNKGFTYIEIGDGEELWENKNMNDIIDIHTDVYILLSKFYEKNRFFMIYGNHDLVKKNKHYLKKNFTNHYDESKKRKIKLFSGIKVHEGLILKYKGKKIFLVHGHQGDLINDRWWPLGRFLVRKLWRNVEIVGLNNPTGPAKNYELKTETEKRLEFFVKNEKQMMITGHTHRPHFPKENGPSYFNTGSTIHPYAITGIEIESGKLSLVKWKVMSTENHTLYVGKEIIKGPEEVIDYL